LLLHRIVVEKVDADVEQAEAERYGVFTLPTTLIVDPQGTVRHINYGIIAITGGDLSGFCSV